MELLQQIAMLGSGRILRKSAGHLILLRTEQMEYPTRPQAVARYSVTFPALSSDRPIIIIATIIIVNLIIITCGN